MADWYYEETGAQRGPVSEADLNVMLTNRLLLPNTLVWSASLGSSWKPASQTPLEAAPQRAEPPPLPQAAITPPPLPAATTKLTFDQQHVVYRPEQVPPTDDYAKWLAFTPLLLLAIDFVIFAGGNNTVTGRFAGVTPFLGFWGSLIFAGLDARNLHHSWRNPKPKALVPFVLLSPVAYFWRRTRILGSSFDYLWIWVACFVAWAMGLGLMMPG